jgi:hypothetical protein
MEYKYNKISPTRLYWEPRNPELTVVIKKIIEPVPMYVRKVNMEIPVLGKPVGFDFEVGDWAAPYGNGRENDFVFEMNSRWKDLNDFDSKLNLTFSNSWDGILPFGEEYNRRSILVSMQQATENGYEKEWKRAVSANHKEGRKNWDIDSNQHFVFRVRTKTDDQGKLVMANYGKIYNNIIFGSKVTDTQLPVITFTYYYNPDPKSRSLEFAPTRNLAPQPGNRRNRWTFPP